MIPARSGYKDERNSIKKTCGLIALMLDDIYIDTVVRIYWQRQNDL